MVPLNSKVTHCTCIVTETEKYAHVTFFFNGGVEKQFEGEERCLVPSPKVATYDLLPPMSSAGVADKVSARIYILFFCHFFLRQLLHFIRTELRFLSISCRSRYELFQL